MRTVARGAVRGAAALRRSRGRAGILAALLGLLAISSSASPSIRFVPETDSNEVRSAFVATLSQLREDCPTREVEVDDPYHERRMRYFAFEFRCVLDHGFRDTGGAATLRGKGMLLGAADGYTRPVSGEALLEEGAWLAFGEVALMQRASAAPRFTPIDRRKLDPAPFYLVWSEPGQKDPHRHPWPYQLVRIEIASFREAFPNTVPTGLDSEDSGWKGYALFERACASCHAINGEGGTIGPDLNVPLSIVEYRPIDQIKGYIRNPEATRYTSMPAHPELDASDLDALIQYFRAMSERKRDPRAQEPTVHE